MAGQSTAKAGESKQSGKEGKIGEQRLLCFREHVPRLKKRKEEGRKRGKDREKNEKKEERVARRINK